jgi:hypothetical protein
MKDRVCSGAGFIERKDRVCAKAQSNTMQDEMLCFLPGRVY